MSVEKLQALVIGGGPAGLMAASELARGGMSVVLAESKPTVARKFLMAGKSGLNLTKDEGLEAFCSAFHGSLAGTVAEAVRSFGPGEVRNWAESLGQPVFTGSSGRVFPKTMKASPLLRSWLGSLDGVEIRTRWRWTGFDGRALSFETPDGARGIEADHVVLALGGASWSRLGSDAAWVPWLAERGVEIAPFAPDNAGLNVDWSQHMARHFGAPVKAARLMAGGARIPGEFVISERGLEGSGVYSASRFVRRGHPLTVDLTPDLDMDTLRARLAKPRGKATVAAHLRKVLKLDPVRLALLMEFGRPLPEDLAPLIKAVPLAHTGLRPLDEAISSAGGIAAGALARYRIRALPSVYAAGEMLDWEAPTGGYLITGCLATGRAAARQVLSSLV